MNTAQKLKAHVEALLASDPFELDGLTWAKQSRTELAAAIGVAERTITRLVKTSPFQTCSRKLDGAKSPNVFFIRLAAKLPPMLPKQAAREMASIWEKEIGLMTVNGQVDLADWTLKQRNMWGFALAFMEDPLIKALPVDPASFAVKAFAWAIKPGNWLDAVTAIKEDAKRRPNREPRFLKYPSVRLMNGFARALAYAYVVHLQASGQLDPEGSADDAAALAPYLALMDAFEAMLAAKPVLESTPKPQATMFKTYGAQQAASH